MGATKWQLVMVLVVAIISASMMSTAMGAEHCPQQDDLVVVQARLGNGSFFKTWTGEHCCTEWAGVTCNAQDMVTAIKVWTNDTTAGRIPGNLAKFTALETLVIGYDLPNIKAPNEDGSWPEEMKNLVNLTYLKITGTGAFHQVPAVFGKIPNLKVLNLSHNAFHGVDESFAKAPKLETLDLSDNSLSGSLILTLSPALKYLDLSGNEYEGEIPADIITKWPSSLEDVRLARNSLTGSPEALFKAGEVSLRHIDLGINQLGPKLPSTLPSALEYLDLSYNNLADLVDQYFFAPLSSLRHIDLGHNRQLGAEMLSLRLPKGLTYLDFSYNVFNGRLSTQVVELQNIKVFQVSNNKLCGPIPPSKLCGMQWSYFENNTCIVQSDPLRPCETSARDDAPLARPASLRVDPLRYRFLTLQE